ncbi:MAG: S-adenosylmethionine decarboxylase proenzyme [Candidatus Parcubacteria bacterium]|jgi:S-adenosylmethionine decarboxylase
MSNQETEQFGVHYMLDGYGADHDLLKDIPTLTKILSEVPAEMGMHTICEPTVVEVGPKNRKDPGGVSGFVMIAESHMSFHTFPKRGFITIDVYTCQDEIDSKKLTKKFIEAFKLSSHDEKVVKRGMLYPSDNIYE